MPEEQNALYLMLGEMRGDIKQVLENQSKTAGRLSELERRVTILEAWRLKALGVGAALFFAFTILKDQIMQVISKLFP